jgi:AAA15 family ATPase/GTPase
MLIRFRVSNFLSFNQQVELSMIPGKTRQHLEQIVSSGKGRNDIDILKAALVYGANASGKSNLVKAISFAKDLITGGTKARQTIPTRPFKLDSKKVNEPSKFEFEFRQGDTNYLYGFELNAQRIISEWLYEIKKTTEEMLFDRSLSAEEKTVVAFGSAIQKKDKEFLEFVARGTRPNQLFLTESIDRNVEYFKAVFNWFAETLIIIFPGTRFAISPYVAEGKLLANQVVEYLEKFDTGVCGFQLVPVETKEVFPSDLLAKLETNIKPGERGAVLFVLANNANMPVTSYVVEKEAGGELKTSKLMFKHMMGNCGEQTLFEMDEESDGTIRLIDLIPILNDPGENSRVYLIDEFDRSLHPDLSHNLIKFFLQNINSHSQVIATTHEATLLDLELIRRDEVWFVQKDKTGASSLYSLEEFSPRYDKEIEKGYLLGRYGATPFIKTGELEKSSH